MAFGTILAGAWRPPTLAVAIWAVVAVLSAGSAAAQTSSAQKRIDDAVDRTVKFLYAQQKKSILLITGELREHKTIEVDGVWKDVSLTGGLSLTIKGRKYDGILGALPPGWFAPEPVLGLQRKACDQMGGHTALVTLAMLTAGQTVNRDERMLQAVNCLIDMVSINTTDKKVKWELRPGPVGTYALSLRAAALEYANRGARSGSDLKNRLIKAINRDVKELMDGCVKEGGWTYTMRDPESKGASYWDMSNTQYGILGLWAGERAGVEMSDTVWKNLNALFLEYQQSDGGWTYFPAQKDGKTKDTMTQAGIASLFLFLDVLHTRTRGIGKPDTSPFSPQLLKTLEALDRALELYGRLHKPDPNDGYYMYGVERIGVAGGYKYFGKSDWFREGAEAVLAAQSSDGSWKGRHPAYATGAAAWNILFLVYGGAPVLINKLRYGPSGDWTWHNYPRDVANAAAWFDAAYETRYNWQIVSISDSFTDWMDAPFLMISGHKKLDFSDKDIRKLRRYTESGGTLLFTADGGRREFIDSVLDLSRQMYPPDKFPERQFTAVPADHPIYRLNTADAKKASPFARVPLWHMADSARSFAILLPEDIHHVWHGKRPTYRPECFELMGNLATYALDRGLVNPRLRDPITAGAKRGGPGAGSGTLRLGVVKYTSTGQAAMQETPGRGNLKAITTVGDWAGAGEAWYIFEEWLTYTAGYKIKETVGVELTEDLSVYDVLHMSGRHGFTLTEAERDNLRKYLSAGGTLLVDSPGGQKGDFLPTIDKLLRGWFEEAYAPAKIDSPVIKGFRDISADFSLSRQGKLINPTMTSPTEMIRTVTLDGRPAVVVVRGDISLAMADIRTWQRMGFSSQTARDLAANVLVAAAKSRGSSRR